MKYTLQDMQDIFDAWKETQPRPHLCRLTPARKKLIQGISEEGHTVEDIKVLMEFAKKSTDSMARWWRGENPERKTYMGLDNLLRKTKLTERIEKALNWKMDMEENVEKDDIMNFPFRIVGGSSGKR